MAVRSETGRKPRARDATRAEKRLEILTKAREVFIKFGYRKTGIEDVGKACGLAGPAIYYYFPSKEELFAEIIRTFGEKELEDLRRTCLASDDPKKQIFAFIHFQLKALQEFTQQTQLSDLASIIPLACEAGESCHRAKQALLESILREGQRRGVFRKLPTERTAILLTSFIGGLALDQMRALDRSSLDEDAALLAKLCLEGLCR